jgi:hypothetical protein
MRIAHPAKTLVFRSPRKFSDRVGERHASQGVALSDFCRAVAVTNLWEFLERQGLRRGPVEIYGEMELLRLLDQFLIAHSALRPRAMCSTSRCRNDGAALLK